MLLRSRGRFVKCLLRSFVIVAFGCAQIWAQSTAQISGIVSDGTGAVLPGVEVAVTQTDTGLVRNVVTNDTGAYVVPNLPVGPYRSGDSTGRSRGSAGKYATAS